MKLSDRFADTGVALIDVADHFVVQCPECDGKAIIRREKEVWKLKCTACFHVEKPGHWYGGMTLLHQSNAENAMHRSEEVLLQTGTGKKSCCDVMRVVMNVNMRRIFPHIRSMTVL